jgi:hypothetical protein
MTRRFADPVEVQRSLQDGEPVPATFLWRGRLYVVRNVLGHWWERRSWWTSAAGRAVHGEGDAPAGGPAAAGADREVWRVEASRGRSFGSGVYDLCVAGTGPADGRGWHLIRVVD